MLVDGQPRERGRGPRGRRGHRGRRPLPREPRAREADATAVYGATIYAVDGTYDDCSRLSVELSFELDWAFVNVGLRSYYAEGSKTLAFEIAEQLGWELPDAVVAPIASGAMFSKVHQGFGELLELGLVEGTPPRLYGGQAEGCAPVAAAFAEERKVTPLRPDTVARSLAIGNPADGDLAVATARAIGRRDPRGRRGRGGREHGAARRDERRLRRDRRGRDARRAASTRSRAARSASRDTVVLLVTGDGLKTPQPVADRLRPVEVEADADALLERLGVAI